jgi:BirA family transcriptional regulator, biotin operon repressor / biotin---[acetyl-CoA-carboxylase] ligase
MGKNLVFLPECHSTNTAAMDLSRESTVPEGTLVITENQTAGRGQRGNNWLADQGKNLTLTFVLHPKFLPAKDQFLLSQAVSLGIYDLLEKEVGAQVKIKWPNDIMVSGKKVCGILIENQLVGSSIEMSVVGIGLNVNQTHFAVPTASSLASVKGKTFDLDELLDDLCHYVELRYLQLKNQLWVELKEDYRKALYWRNEVHTFFSKGRNFAGVIEGVDEAGRLMVKVEKEMKAFDLKEILYIHEMK